MNISFSKFKLCSLSQKIIRFRFKKLKYNYHFKQNTAKAYIIVLIRILALISANADIFEI